MSAVLLVLKNVLNMLPGWVWAILCAGCMAFSGVQMVRASNAKASASAAQIALANDRATYAQAAQIAEQAAREIETRREADKEKVIADARKQTEQAQAAASAADLAATGLRRQVAAYVAAIRGTPSNLGAGVGSKSEPSADPLNLLAWMLDRHSRELVSVGEYADRLRVAGGACEASYTGLLTAPR